jgi:hypothetical protein
MNDSTRSLERQRWFEHGVAALRERFDAVGYTIPRNIRVSVGWPKGAAFCNKIGQCWLPAASSDQHAQLFISPELADDVRILGVLAHELVHATVGTEAGHRAPFKRCALRVGLCGRMTATTESDAFRAWAAALVARIGPYPAGFLTIGKKQSTRLLKCECPSANWSIRLGCWFGGGRGRCGRLVDHRSNRVSDRETLR